MKMNPVVHFEMPMKDRDRMSKFYSSVFGWEMNVMGADMGNYVMAMTSPSDRNGPKRPGAINGGFFPSAKGNSHPLVTIAVDDINDHIKQIKKAGGKVLGKPMEIPGVGWYVAILDTEGNRVSLLQPLGR